MTIENIKTDLSISITAPFNGGAAMAWGLIDAAEVALLFKGSAGPSGPNINHFSEIADDWIAAQLPANLQRCLRTAPKWDRHFAHPEFDDAGMHMIISREMTYDIDGVQVTITITTGNKSVFSKLTMICAKNRMIAGELVTSRTFNDYTPD